MRILTANVNGIRAATRKGFLDWMLRQKADVVCLQEVRARVDQMDPRAQKLRNHAVFHQVAERPGYSGVSIYARKAPDRVHTDLGWPSWDPEARYLQADFGDLSVISLYVPSGSASQERQDLKMGFLDKLMAHLIELKATGRSFIVCGDWNIAHTKADIKNWRGNQKNSGFLPEERAWMDQLFGDAGWVDAFRCLEQAPEQYTWWSNRGRAFENNTGWRLDYQVITPDLATRVQATQIYTQQRFSDHAPFIVDYEGTL